MKIASARLGITWFEVMVVVVMLGLLGAVLLPSVYIQLHKKVPTKRAMCANHQRQIFLGMSVYANDHEGHFPVFSCDGAGRWVVAGDPRLDPTATAIASLELFSFTEGGDLRPRMFACPAKPDAKPQTEANNSGEMTAISAWASAGPGKIGYAYDWSVPDDGRAWQPDSMVTRVVMADRDRQAHKEIVVAVFADGHVGSVKNFAGTFINRDAGDDDIYTGVNDGPMSMPGHGSTTRAFVR